MIIFDLQNNINIKVSRWIIVTAQGMEQVHVLSHVDKSTYRLIPALAM